MSRILKFTTLLLVLIVLFYIVLFSQDNNTLNTKDNFVHFIAVGDVMIGRGVNSAINKRGINWPFNDFSKYSNQADIVFGNAEFTCIGNSPIKEKYILGTSTSSVKSLQLAGFNLVSLANNHILDYGSEGLLMLLNELDSLNILYSGAGKTAKEANKPILIKKNGNTICFLSYSLFSNTRKSANENIPAISVFSQQQLVTDLKEANKFGNIIIVSFHWGVEYSSYPTIYQQKIAHIAADNGANIIIGHHPHVIQGVELYKNSIILYSLGNFIFDSRDIKTKEGLIFECLLSSNTISNPALTPLYIDKLKTTFTDSSTYFYRIENEINVLSKIFNTHIIYKKGKLYISHKKKD
ncbi:MAG: hypothetical protein A2252_04875 [Elusimicrobia bacterium RIFOXYA2_FULL_39_19]|nr:MAG: hypothetical protein A2252_04875 [Elusimicrobia bacterium RIFOXYA2_FULL_39_19]